MGKWNNFKSYVYKVTSDFDISKGDENEKLYYTH